MSLPEELLKDSRIEAYAVTGRGCSGNYQRNFGIEQATGDYVYFLDDDNIMHPEFWRVVIGYLSNTGIVVNQIWPNGIVRLHAHPDNMRVGGIDTAQVLLPRSFIKDIRWDENNYCADGVFFQEVYRKNGRFNFLPYNLAFYNYLRQEDDYV